MRKSKEQVKVYLAGIRRALVLKPDATLTEIRTFLRTKKIELEENYILKLRNKVLNERAVRADRTTLNIALANYEDAMTMLNESAWKILLEDKSTNFERLAAIREIRTTYGDVFEKMFDAGVFNRQLGSLELKIRNRPLTQEQIDERVKVAQNWGLLPAQNNGSPTQ